MCCTYRLAYGGMTRHLVHPSLEWEVGSWWRDMLCFQTSLGRDHYFCQLPPRKQWAHRHLRKMDVKTSQAEVLNFLKRRVKDNNLSQIDTNLHILLWCAVSHPDPCVLRWLSGYMECHRKRRPSWFFHSEPCPRWSPLKPRPCCWHGTPATARDNMVLVSPLKTSICY